MIQDIFETLGFKEEEMKTYLTLLDGPRTAGDLSKTLGVPRPTLYGHLERLVSAGLAREDSERGVKTFTPEPVEQLRTLYRRKIHALRNKEKSLDDILPQLENRSGANLLRPRLNVFEGKKALRSALEDILSMKSGSVTHSFMPIRTLMEMVSTDFTKALNRERIRRGINMRGLWARNQGLNISEFPFLAWGPELKSELRYAPLGTDSLLGYWVYGHKTLFLSPQPGISGYMLENADMANMMRAQHAAVWEKSEPVPYDKSIGWTFAREIEDAA
jgi:predicted transcriptional regulator